MINFFWPVIENLDVSDMWFQQNVATSHITQANLVVSFEKFVSRLISKFGNINWPPRSCDLTPMEFILWGCTENRVYADSPQTWEHLKANIHGVVAAIQPEMRRKVFERKIEVRKSSRGGHLPMAQSKA